jgi:transposase-like protein
MPALRRVPGGEAERAPAPKIEHRPGTRSSSGFLLLGSPAVPTPPPQSEMGSENQDKESKKPRGRPSKYPAHLREFVEYLYHETSAPMGRVAEGLGLSPQLLATWTAKLPALPHRKKGSGNAPTSPIPALEARNAELQAEVDALRAKLAEIGEPVGSAKDLLEEIKSKMFGCLVGGGHDLKDLAQALRAAIALDERENPESSRDGPQMVHYIPREVESYTDPEDENDPEPAGQE